MVPKQTPTELLDTALHEAGHALVSLLLGADIRAWKIGKLKTSRKQFQETLDFTKVYCLEEGRVLIGPFRSKHYEFLCDMAGFAATNCNTFPLARLPRSPSANHSDEHSVCAYLKRQLAEDDLPYVRKTVERSLRRSYRPIRNLFRQRRFERALRILTAYMLEHMYEKHDNINRRMRRRLEQHGVTTEELARMRKALKNIDPRLLTA